MVFMVEKMGLRQVYLQVLRVFRASIISRILLSQLHLNTTLIKMISM